jgi:hypothetical protein
MRERDPLSAKLYKTRPGETMALLNPHVAWTKHGYWISKDMCNYIQIHIRVWLQRNYGVTWKIYSLVITRSLPCTTKLHFTCQIYREPPCEWFCKYQVVPSDPIIQAIWTLKRHCSTQIHKPLTNIFFVDKFDDQFILIHDLLWQRIYAILTILFISRKEHINKRITLVSASRPSKMKYIN